mgnify:CR=1 FL=1
MDRVELNKASIDNLCSFWKSTGCLKLGDTDHGTTQHLNISKTWPHRYWLDWDGISKHLPDLVAASEWAVSNGGVLTPAWGGDEAIRVKFEQTLSELGYEFRFLQTQMYLDMTTYCPQRVSQSTPPIQVSRATLPEEILIFCAICGSAFAYDIDIESILASSENPDTHILVAYNSEGSPVATVILFQTGNIIGVHQVGVSPQHRRQGIAKEVMIQALAMGNSLLRDQQQADKTEHPGYMTLQAGEAAKGLYSTLGFKEQFVYKNFLKQ